MKKVFLSLLVIGSLFLFGSCKKGSQIINDAPRADVYQALKLDEVEKGRKLVGNTNAPYYDVKVSNDLTGTLFYQTIEVTEYVEKNHSINLKPIAFAESFANGTNPTLVELVNILNNKDYGIKKEALGVNLVEDANSAYLLGKLTTTNTITIPESFEGNTLVVVYLPIYGIYFNSGEAFQNVFLMMPVYYSLTTNENVSVIVGDIKNYQCDDSILVEINRGVYVLPSNASSAK